VIGDYGDIILKFIVNLSRILLLVINFYYSFFYHSHLVEIPLLF
jgi:hypothetical protein